MNTNSTRGRTAAAFVATLALGATATLTTSPAQSAVVAGDCTAPFPVAEVAADDAVTTLTVIKGTTPVEFTGTILGTINDGIAPGLDMVMADFGTEAGDTEIDKAGIWQGMSGSPVYAEDGRLIGAVAYGLAWGPSPVAGITPYEDMDDYLDGAAPSKIAVGSKAARAIAAEAGVTAAQASQGFRQLPMPMALSGVSQQRLTQLKKKGPDYLNTRGVTAVGSAAAASDAGPESLVAGGNLGAALSYGDITLGGVGTVTSVCDDRLVGFGHPFTYGGATTLGLMPADAVYIQEDPVGPGFKVANLGVPAGTIDQDRLTGISGSLGVLPAETDVTSTVTYGARNRTGSSAALSQDYIADVTFSQILANHDRVVDAIQGGSEVSTYSVTGTDAAGNAFDIAFSERYTSKFDIAFESIFEIADIVYSLSRMQGVTVQDITATSDVADSTAVYRVKELQQKVKGSWVKIGRRKPAVAAAGSTMQLRATIGGAGTTKVVPLSIKVPAKAKRRGFLEVTGGASTFSNAIYRAKTPAAMEQAVEDMVRNDEIAATTYFFKRGKDISTTASSDAQDLVVRGRSFAEVKVRR